MRLYKRHDFVRLPEKTIYSRIDGCDLMHGLFCKTSGSDYTADFVEQNLIGEPGFPNNIMSGSDALDYKLSLRDNFKDFTTDLDCSGRDGMFEEDDCFVVWDNSDIKKLIDYLNNCI